MGAHAPATGHDQKINDKTAGWMVALSLALFFAMSAVGHFVFVASAHHAEEPAATKTHETH